MRHFKGVALSFISVFLVLTPILTKTALAAATVTLSSAGSVSKGSLITVTIRENSGGEPVNAAAVTLNYPTDKLSYVSISNSAAFNVAAASSGGGGSVRIDRGALSPVTGSQVVASVTFKGLTDSGSATVNIANASVVSANSNSDITGGTSGTTIALKAPVVAPAAPPPDTVPPTITNIKTSDSRTTSTVITWTTSEPASSEVNYGPSQSYGLSTSDPAAVTEHKLVLNSPLIQPATKYHFMVRSVDPAGNAVTSADGTFTTTGATLVVKVLDQNKKPAKGAIVEFDNKKGTADKNGVATVKDVGVGKKYGVISYKGHDFPVNMEVKLTDKPQEATFHIKVPNNYWVPTIILIILLTLAAYLIGRGGGHGPGKSTLVGFGVMKSKVPFLRRLRAPSFAGVAVKEISPTNSR